MKRILRTTFSWYFSRKALPYWCVMLLDCAIIIAAGMVSSYICTGGNNVAHNFWTYMRGLLYVQPLFIAGMRIFHTYNGILRYSTIADLVKLTYALVFGYALVLIIRQFQPSYIVDDLVPLTSLLLSFILSLGGQWALRILIKWLYEDIVLVRNHNVFIYGIMDGGLSLARAILAGHSGMKLAGFVSPDPDYTSRYIMGKKVYPANLELIDVMKKANATALIVSPLQRENFPNQTELVDKLIENKIRIMMLPSAEEWTPDKQIGANQIQDVDIEDLLPRDKIQVDMNAIGEMLTGKAILITGAAGSIGSEMARQIIKYKPSKLILVDQAETPMHDVRRWMANHIASLQGTSPTPDAALPVVKTIVGNISNPTHMEELFSEFRPEYVFHAAAYKHVPMMEDNPAMAVQNNIYGTRVIADLAVKYGTKKFVMISTDKAVNPTNVMGCSKRICEIYCQALNKAIADGNTAITPQAEGAEKNKCQFITTRFGNVLGSNGSVIPIFREQIRKGGPLTVTHPDIIRYFMLISEACQLVLEAGTMGHGGEIFVFDMGKPVRIADLAKRMIDLSGAKGIEIKYTGLRDGEKLFEEVLNDAELTVPTVHAKIKVAKVREYPYDQALANEEELLKLSFSYDDMAIVKKMKDIVPEYKSQQSKYETLDK